MQKSTAYLLKTEQGAPEWVALYCCNNDNTNTQKGNHVTLSGDIAANSMDLWKEFFQKFLLQNIQIDKVLGHAQ